jgi:hypothetical protein
VCYLDPKAFGVARVGARIKTVEREKLNAKERQSRRNTLTSIRQTVEWEFDTENPVTLRFTGPCIADVLHKVRDGELIPADAEAAKLCGLRSFEEPATVLKKAKAAAVKRFDACYGEGAFAQLEQERAGVAAEAAERAEKAKAAAERAAAEKSAGNKATDDKASGGGNKRSSKGND